MLLAQHLHLLVQQRPVAAVLAYRDNGDNHSRGRGQIGRLAGLLLQRQKLLYSCLNLSILCLLLSVRERSVNLLGEVPVGLDDLARHCGERRRYCCCLSDAVGCGVKTRSMLSAR